MVYNENAAYAYCMDISLESIDNQKHERHCSLVAFYTTFLLCFLVKDTCEGISPICIWQRGLSKEGETNVYAYVPLAHFAHGYMDIITRE